MITDQQRLKRLVRFLPSELSMTFLLMNLTKQSVGLKHILYQFTIPIKTTKFYIQPRIFFRRKKVTTNDFLIYTFYYVPRGK